MGSALGIVTQDPTSAHRRVPALLQGSARVEAATAGVFDVWLASTQNIGGLYSGQERLLLVGLERADWNAEESEALQTVFCSLPESVLSVASMENKPIDHRLLAEVAAHLAKAFGGLIDLEHHQRLPSSVTGAGKAFPMGAAAHLVDSAVLLAWSKDPSFSLVK